MQDRLPSGYGRTLMLPDHRQGAEAVLEVTLAEADKHCTRVVRAFVPSDQYRALLRFGLLMNLNSAGRSSSICREHTGRQAQRRTCPATRHSGPSALYRDSRLDSALRDFWLRCSDSCGSILFKVGRTPDLPVSGQGPQH